MYPLRGLSVLASKNIFSLVLCDGRSFGGNGCLMSSPVSSFAILFPDCADSDVSARCGWTRGQSLCMLFEFDLKG